MSTIATLTPNETGADSRIDINANFANLNADKVEGQSSSVDSEVALFSGIGGKTIKRASGSGLAKVTSGVLSTVTAPSGAVVGDTDSQTLTNKTINASNNTVSNVTEAMQTLADNTTNDASTSKHGYMKKLPNNAAVFYDGTGAFSAPAVNIAATNGVATRAYNTASGNQVIAHGLGATPKVVRLTAMANFLGTNNQINIMQSFGTYNGSTTASIFHVSYGDSGAPPITTVGNSSTNVITLLDTTSNGQTATVTVDGTNITIAWTKVSTPGNSNNMQILWEVEG